MINHPTTLFYNRLDDNQVTVAGYPAWIIHYTVDRVIAGQTMFC